MAKAQPTPDRGADLGHVFEYYKGGYCVYDCLNDRSVALKRAGEDAQPLCFVAAAESVDENIALGMKALATFLAFQDSILPVLDDRNAVRYRLIGDGTVRMWHRVGRQYAVWDERKDIAV